LTHAANSASRIKSVVPETVTVEWPLGAESSAPLGHGAGEPSPQAHHGAPGALPGARLHAGL